MAVVVLRKASMFNPKMYLPPELVEIILQSVVAPPKSRVSHNHSDSDDQSEFDFEHADFESDHQEEEDQPTENDQDQETDSNRGDDDADEQDEFDDRFSRLLCVIS